MDLDDQHIPPVQFVPAGESEKEQNANLKLVKPSPGYPSAAGLIAEAIHKDSDISVLDFTPQQVTVRFRIDGLWHAGAAMDREMGDYMLATLKQLAGMDYRDRRNKQTGQFQTEYLKSKQKFKLVSQGIKTGERVAIYLSYKKPPMETLEELGMRSSMKEKLAPHLALDSAGLILSSAIPGEGYTSVWRAVLGGCDRLTRDYFVLEEVNEVEEEVINISSITFDRAKNETAMTPMPQLLLREPNVLAFNEIPDGAMLNQYADLSKKQDIPIFLRAPGKNCLDTVLRTLSLKPDPAKFVELLKVVVCMRMIRKLCENCKVPYQPHAKLLSNLGLPPGRISELHKPFVFQPGMVDEDENEIEPCSECGGIGYKGRTGIFEMLELFDDLRRAIVQQPKLNVLTQIAQKNRHISMRQEGAVLVARGVTSVEELQRILKA